MKTNFHTGAHKMQVIVVRFVSVELLKIKTEGIRYL